nr:nucleobase-ascorbate transporter 11 [Quercus suber]
MQLAFDVSISLSHHQQCNLPLTIAILVAVASFVLDLVASFITDLVASFVTDCAKIAPRSRSRRQVRACEIAPSSSGSDYHLRSHCRLDHDLVLRKMKKNTKMEAGSSSQFPDKPERVKGASISSRLGSMFPKIEPFVPRIDHDPNDLRSWAKRTGFVSDYSGETRARMAIRSSKGKLAKAQEKKGKDKSHQDSRDGTFWDDMDATVSKAHEAISVKDLKLLATRASSKLMSSHVHKVMQVLGKSLYLSGKYIDYEEKLASAQSKIDEVLAKLQKAGLEAMNKFKKSEQYFDKLCNYYVEGFELFCNYMAKQHLDLDLSTLEMEEVENGILADCPSRATTDLMDEDTIVTTEAPIDSSPSNPS